MECLFYLTCLSVIYARLCDAQQVSIFLIDGTFFFGL